MCCRLCCRSSVADVCSPPFARVLKPGYAFLVSSVQIDSEERHAEQLRTARVQLDCGLQAAEDSLKGDIARVDTALTASDGCMRGLECQLLEARQMDEMTAGDVTLMQRELNQIRSEAAMLQHKLTTMEAENEKNKARFAEELEVVASVARSAAVNAAETRPRWALAALEQLARLSSVKTPTHRLEWRHSSVRRYVCVCVFLCAYTRTQNIPSIILM